MFSSERSTRWCKLLFHRLPLIFAAALLAIGVTINFLNVIARYFFQAAFYWAEEAMVYLMIWAIFLAAIAIAYDRTHLTMDFFSTRASSFWKRVTDLSIVLITAFVCLFMATQSWTIARILARNGQKSLALEIPMVIPQSALLFGFIMIAAAVICRFLFVGDDNGKVN